VIRRERRRAAETAAVIRSLVPLRTRRAVSRDGVEPGAIGPDRLAIEVVRHLNSADLAGFRRIVAPAVRVTAAPSEDTLVLGAAELFSRLSGIGVGQTLCASRIRCSGSTARIDLEIAWISPSGTCTSGLGTLDLTCAGGVVTELTLELDVDPAVERAAMSLARWSRAAPGEPTARMAEIEPECLLRDAADRAGGRR